MGKNSTASGSDQPAKWHGWWERWPELWLAEQEAFRSRGIDPVILHQRDGVLIIGFDWSVEGETEPLKLQVGYSVLHPFARPIVSAPEVTFPRHQHPIEKDLCLLPDEPGMWNPRQLVADYLTERIPQLKGALAAREAGEWEEAAKLEEPTPDPLLPYYNGASDPGSILIFDGARLMPQGNYGIATFSISGRSLAMNDSVFEAILLRLDPPTGRTLTPNFSPFPGADSGAPVQGRWVRMRPPATGDAKELLAAAEAEIRAKTALSPRDAQLLDQALNADLGFTLIVFEDEATYSPAREGMACLLLATRGKKTSLIWSEPLSDGASVRLPISQALRTKTGVIVGVGAIGSFIAIELARAGLGRLVVLDNDIVLPGNGVRWPLGREAWGLSKSGAVGTFIQRNYPLTEVAAYSVKVGSTTAIVAAAKTGQNTLNEMRKIFHGADLIIEATGSTEAQQAIAFECRDLSKPFISAYGTPGVAGGVVATFPAASDSCFVCLNEHWVDGTLPAPIENKDAIVTPRGCSAPTFTGGSFDLEEVSLEAVREAITVLTEPDRSMAATLDLVRLSDEHGRRELPVWERHDIPAHARCCGSTH